MVELEKIGEPIDSNSKSKTDDTEDILEPKKGLLNFFKTDHPIGKMNGHWPSLFKFILIIAFFMAPTLFGWMVWSTTENFANQYNRERTVKIEEGLNTLHIDLEKFQSEITKGISGININASRLKELETRLSKLENEHQLTQSKIGGLDQRNTEEHTKILLLLESIKTKMDLINK